MKTISEVTLAFLPATFVSVGRPDSHHGMTNLTDADFIQYELLQFQQ